MGILSSLLEGISGSLHFYVYVGKEPAAEIRIEEKTIIIEIKNPVLAVEFGARELLKGSGCCGKPDPHILDSAKKMGYRIIIKYRRLEFSL